MNYLFLLVLTAAVLPSMVVCKEVQRCPNMALMEKCQRDAEDDYEVDRNKKDTNSKAWCCHQWQAYDCQYDLGKTCVDFEKELHNTSMNALKEILSKTCSDWPEDKCSGLKWWAITLIVIGTLVGVAVIGFLIFIFVFKKRSSRRYSAPKG